MITALITSPQFRAARRALATYVLRDRNGRIDFFHCPTDPHSHLALQALIRLLRRYEGELEMDIYLLAHAKESGLDAYATSLEDQLEWAFADARELAEVYRDVGLRFSAGNSDGREPKKNNNETRRLPTENLTKMCNSLAMSLLDSTFGKDGVANGCWTISTSKPRSPAFVYDTLERLIKIGDLAFSNDIKGLEALAASFPAIDDAYVQSRLRAAAARLDKKGHYLTGMTRYGYEWFWGVDRLHYLEVQLNEQFGRTLKPIVEFNRTTKLRFLPVPGVTSGVGATPSRGEPPVKKSGSFLRVELVYSFRSPYSQLCLSRLYRLCDWYRVDLKLMPVLPMVMRGFVVNLNKRIYIVLDAKREADLHHVKFGRIADPVGLGVERTFAVYHEIVNVRKIPRAREFLLAFGECVFGEGVDVATDSGILTVVRRSRVSRAEISDEDVVRCAGNCNVPNAPWRAFEAVNQQKLYSQFKLWGVPCFRLVRVEGETETPIFTTWGQDRLFALESAILREVEARASL